MDTQVLMKRKLFDSVISQQSDTGFLNGKELEQAGNRFRILNKMPIVKLQEWLRINKTVEFIEELRTNLGVEPKKASRGRNSATWLHPYLFIDFALYISPKLKIEVYKWLYDELLKYRNNSGDSYKKMTGALWQNTSNKSLFPKYIVSVAKNIKNACGVIDWQSATEKQLELRDRIHEYIALLCDVLKNNEKAVVIGITKAIDEVKS